MEIIGGYLYALDPRQLSVFDIAPAGDPVLQTSIRFDYPYTGWNFDIAGDTAYLAYSDNLADVYEYGVIILDVDDPANPVVEEKLPLWTDQGYPDQLAVWVSGERLYLQVKSNNAEGQSASAILIYDLQSPGQPVHASDYPVSREVSMVEAVEDWMILEDAPYLRFIDASNPGSPVERASWETPGKVLYARMYDDSLYAGWFNDVYLYAPGENNGVQVLDLSEIADPRLLASAGFFGHGDISDIDRAGETLYVSNGDGGLFTLAEAYTIQGEVRSENGSPYPNATTVLSGTMTTTSALDGSFVFHDLSPNDYELTGSVPGYRIVPPMQTVDVPYTLFTQQVFVLAEAVNTTYMTNKEVSLIYTDTQSLPTTFSLPEVYTDMPATVIVTPTRTGSLHGWTFTGHAFEIGADYLDALYMIRNSGLFIDVAIDYSEADIGSVSDESGLILMEMTAEGWIPAGSDCLNPAVASVDEAANHLEAQFCNPGMYALFGTSYSIVLPFLAR